MVRKKHREVDPYPVRVWWGYAGRSFRASLQDMATFHKALGSIFIPATVQMMLPLGLVAYLPTIVPRDSDPSVPDEIALVFYRSKEMYRNTGECVAGRAYSLLHKTVFNFENSDDIPTSHSDFPEKFGPESINTFPGYYFLFEKFVDWQCGEVMVQVEIRDGVSVDAFNTVASERIITLQKNPPPKLDGAVVSLFGGCLLLWTHWSNKSPVDYSVFKGSDPVRTVVSVRQKPLQISSDPWQPYTGLKVKEGDGFNFIVR